MEVKKREKEMEKEAGSRRMKIIAAHFAPAFDDISPPHLLFPMKCSSSESLKTRFRRYDNRMYYARQSSASQPFFMRPLSTHPNQQQEEKAFKCNAEPLFARPITTMEPNFPKLQSTPKYCTLSDTQVPNFARPATTHNPSIIYHSSNPYGKEWSPRMDVAEYGRNYIITVEIPGVNANDIRVELSDTNLRITGRRSNERPSESKCAYHKREIVKGPYQVSWPLPFDANKDSVSAELVDGILQIIVPKL